MAESVQYHIEGNISQYEALEKIGIFNACEVKEIIRKTKQFEYKLQRKNKSREDYLKYVLYLSNVMKLVKKRRKRLKLKPSADKTITKALRDKMDFLYQALLKRFSGDTGLWAAYFKFCKEMKWSYATSQAYVNMLKVHNNKTWAWIEASEHEWTENQSVDRARKLLLQGLRFNPFSKDLYVAHFRLELKFINFLLNSASKGLQRSKEDVLIERNIKEGKLLNIIYEEAQNKFMENPEESVDLAVNFLIECRNMSYSGVIIESIMSDLKYKYPLIELSWDTLALYELEKCASGLGDANTQEENVGKCLHPYEQGVSHVDTPKMWEYYLGTCFNLYEATAPGSALAGSRYKLIETIMQRSYHHELPDDVYKKWLDIVAIESPSDVVKHIDFLIAKRPNEGLIVTKANHVMKSNSNKEEIKQLLHKMLPQINSADRGVSFWDKMVRWYNIMYPEEVEDLFEKGLALRGSLLSEVQQFYLDWAFLKKGLDTTRNIFNKFKVKSILSLPVYFKMIDLESKCTKLTSHENIKLLFEVACQQYGGQSPDIWIKYVIYLRSVGDDIGSGSLYKRALQHLEISYVDEFINRFQSLSQSKES